MDPFRKPSVGEKPLQLSAELWGILVDVAQKHVKTRGDFHPPPLPKGAGNLMVKNVSGAIRDQYSIVSLGAALVAPDSKDSFYFDDGVFDTAAPTAGERFAIMQDPAAIDALAEVEVSGWSWAKVSITTATDEWAGPITSDYAKLLAQTAQGLAEIFWLAAPAAYDNAHPYVIGDEVLEAGVYYTCKLASTGHAPPNGTYWNLGAVCWALIRFSQTLASEECLVSQVLYTGIGTGTFDPTVSLPFGGSAIPLPVVGTKLYFELWGSGGQPTYISGGLTPYAGGGGGGGAYSAVEYVIQAGDSFSYSLVTSQFSTVCTLSVTNGMATTVLLQVENGYPAYTGLLAGVVAGGRGGLAINGIGTVRNSGGSGGNGYRGSGIGGAISNGGGGGGGAGPGGDGQDGTDGTGVDSTPGIGGAGSPNGTPVWFVSDGGNGGSTVNFVWTITNPQSPPSVCGGSGACGTGVQLITAPAFRMRWGGEDSTCLYAVPAQTIKPEITTPKKGGLGIDASGLTSGETPTALGDGTFVPWLSSGAGAPDPANGAAGNIYIDVSNPSNPQLYYKT